MLRRGGTADFAGEKTDRTSSNHHKSGGVHVRVCCACKIEKYDVLIYKFQLFLDVLVLPYLS